MTEPQVSQTINEMAFNVAKQFTFALASALTATAKRAQTNTIGDIRNTFTVRNTWVNPGNAMGIKVLPASKMDLSTAVVTRADWLIPHEEGATKKPQGNYLAVPTRFVRRTKRDIIRKTQRPRNLKEGKTVVLPLRNGGRMIFERRNKRLVPLYRLIRQAQIDEAPTLTEQTLKTFEKEFEPLLYQKLRMALATAKQ